MQIIIFDFEKKWKATKDKNHKNIAKNSYAIKIILLIKHQKF